MLYKTIYKGDSVRAISDLQKQQIGIRLPKHLIDDLDEMTKKFSVNRTEIITEAVSSYLARHKEEIFYAGFESACKDLENALNSKQKNETLDEFLDEL